ncbi:MAG: GDSL family lipase, partial [Acidobacteria bacterium]
MLGMNDASYRAFDPAIFETYAAGYRHLVARLKEALPGVRLTLIQPSPFDDVTRPPTFPGGYNAVLRRYGEFVATLAGETGATVVDLNTPVVAGLEKVQRTAPALARQLIPDRVHPGPAGHLVMAAALLRAWGARGLVTRVVLDAMGPRVAAADGAAVRELLEVAGLAPGRYRLTIDGKDVGELSAAELAAGVDLARLDTPMRQQAMPVSWGTGDRQEVLNVRRRLLAGSGSDGSTADAARTLASLADTMAAEGRKATQPRE